MRSPSPTRWMAWLAPPAAASEREAHRQTTVWVSALSIGGAALVATCSALVAPDLRFGVETPAIALVGSLGALLLLRYGRPTAASVALLAGYLAALCFGLLRAGTLYSPGTSLMVVAILIGALLFGWRGVLGLTACVALLLLALTALFETEWARTLSRADRPQPSVFWWMPLPLLIGVILAEAMGRLERRARAAARSEEALHATEERYRTVVENAPLGVVVLDSTLTVTALNPEGCRMLGLDSAAQMLGRKAQQLPAYQVPAIREAFVAVSDRGERVSFEADWTSEAGKAVRARLYGAPVRDAAGRDAGIVVLMVDVSGQRRLEEQLLQAQKLEAVGRLAGGIAHDFNNQLTVILGAAEALMLVAPPELALEVDQIAAAAKRSATLTRQLLAFGRRQLLQPRRLNLNTVVAELDPLLRRTLGAGIEIETVLGAGLWSVNVDPTQLQMALLNLATNARDAMTGRGKLTIETSNTNLDRDYARERGVAPGQYVALAVTDDGAGMDAATRERAFEPFYTTKSQGEGTGLGLAAVHGFVSQSGGLVNVYSEPGQGATFRIYLPRAEGAPEPQEPPARSPRGGAERVLVAEDDPAVRATVVGTLRGAGYRVIETADGEEASQHAAEGAALDLLVTDLVMPKLGGIALARRLHEIRADLPVLFITGYAENGALRHADLRLGSALLAKPFTASELLERVRDLLDARTRH